MGVDLHPDSIALITGGASGIGFETAKVFAKEGIKGIALVDIRAEPLAEAAKLLKTFATNKSFEILELVVNVSDEKEVNDMVSKTVEHFGRLDFAHNNAGISTKGDFATHSTDDFDRVLSVNLRGVFFCMRAEAAVMEKQEPLVVEGYSAARQMRGSIVNTASTASIKKAFNRNVAYNTSKSAVYTMTKTMAVEYAGKGVRCNCIAPGLTATAIFSTDEQKAMLQRESQVVPLKRPAQPEEMADVVVFLCSPRASYIHGEIIHIDAGYCT